VAYEDNWIGAYLAQRLQTLNRLELSIDIHFQPKPRLYIYWWERYKYISGLLCLGPPAWLRCVTVSAGDASHVLRAWHM